MGKYDRRLSAFQVVEQEEVFTGEELDAVIKDLWNQFSPNFDHGCAECRKHGYEIAELIQQEAHGYTVTYPQPTCQHPPGAFPL